MCAALLERCKVFVMKFGKRSYLSRLLKGSTDAAELRLLDKEITDVVQSLGLSLGVQNLAMSQETLQKLDKLDETAAAITTELAAGAAAGGGTTVVVAGGAPQPTTVQLDPSGPGVSALVRELGLPLTEVHDSLTTMFQDIKQDLK